MSTVAPKKIGVLLATFVVANNMIGSGFFLLPASLAPYGLDSVLGWVLTAAGSLLLATVFAGLAVKLAFDERR